jgi:hypothetical protein
MVPWWAGRPRTGVLLMLFALAVLAPPAASLRYYQHDLSNHPSRSGELSTVDDDDQLLHLKVCHTASHTANRRRHCDFVSVSEALAAARAHSVVDVEAGRYVESSMRVLSNNVTLRYITPRGSPFPSPLDPPRPQPPKQKLPPLHEIDL